MKDFILQNGATVTGQLFSYSDVTDLAKPGVEITRLMLWLAIGTKISKGEKLVEAKSSKTFYVESLLDTGLGFLEVELKCSEQLSGAAFGKF